VAYSRKSIKNKKGNALKTKSWNPGLCFQLAL